MCRRRGEEEAAHRKGTGRGDALVREGTARPPLGRARVTTARKRPCLVCGARGAARRQAKSRTHEPGGAARVRMAGGGRGCDDDGARKGRRARQRQDATVWRCRRERRQRACARLRARRAWGLGFGPSGRNLCRLLLIR